MIRDLLLIFMIIGAAVILYLSDALHLSFIVGFQVIGLTIFSLVLGFMMWLERKSTAFVVPITLLLVWTSWFPALDYWSDTSISNSPRYLTEQMFSYASTVEITTKEWYATFYAKFIGSVIFLSSYFLCDRSRTFY